MFVGLDKICTFVKSNHFRRNSKINIYDKSAPTVLSSERPVIPFLKWFDTPKGALAYKFFKMSNKKNFVTNSQCAKVTPTQNNQNKLHSFIIRYVKLRLACDHLFTEPIEPEYKAIYIQHLKSLAV